MGAGGGRAMGELILQLSEGRVLRDSYDYKAPIPPSTAWDRLGNQGEYWRQGCNRLLDPCLTPEKQSLAKLEREFRPTFFEEHSGASFTVAGAAILVGLGLYFVVPAVKVGARKREEKREA